MPIYEYSACEWDCLICGGRFDHIQSPSESALEFCPTCGQKVKRLVSKAQIKVAKYHSADHAGEKGFTVYRKSGEATWEKVAGEGVDAIVGTEEDIQAVQSEKKDVKKINLDHS